MFRTARLRDVWTAWSDVVHTTSTYTPLDHTTYTPLDHTTYRLSARLCYKGQKIYAHQISLLFFNCNLILIWFNFRFFGLGTFAFHVFQQSTKQTARRTAQPLDRATYEPLDRTSCTPPRRMNRLIAQRTARLLACAAKGKKFMHTKKTIKCKFKF